MFQFFIEKKIIPTKQSGFKPGDFCISQFLIITHDNYKSFDEGAWRTRSVSWYIERKR